MLPNGSSTTDPEPVTAQIGALTVARVAYGRSLTVHTDVLEDVYIGFTLRGCAEMSSGAGRVSVVELGSAAVFPAGEPAHISLTEDCVVLGISVPSAIIKTELEHLLGRRLSSPLELAFDLDLTSPTAKTWNPLVRLLVEELRRPTALTQHPVAAKRVEAVILDALLLSHEHNYREELDRGVASGPVTAVGRAIRLIEADPAEDWSTDRLAREVHLSVRALQAGFRREVGLPPMDYVRQTRIRHVRLDLVDGTPLTTSVRAVAQRYGFGHLGRFAATYRDRYGESPVETLRRPLPQ